MANKLKGVERRGTGTYRVTVEIDKQRHTRTFDATSDRGAQIEGDRLKQEIRDKYGRLDKGALTVTLHEAIDEYIAARYPTASAMTKEELLAHARTGHGNVNGYRTARQTADALKAHFKAPDLMINFQNDELRKLTAEREQRTRPRRNSDGSVVDQKIKAATVNRTVTQFLRHVFNYFEKERGWRFPDKPIFENHKRAEPKFRVDPITRPMYLALTADMRPDFKALFDFLLWTGVRSSNAVLLRWDQVTFDQDEMGNFTGSGSARLEVKSKGEEKDIQTITLNEAAVPLILAQRHPDGSPYNSTYIFTYTVKRTRDGRVRSSREPMTISGLHSYWQRHRKEVVAKVSKDALLDPRLSSLVKSLAAVRIHDARHTLATRLAKGGNPTIVREQLGHRSTATTMKYMQNVTAETLAAVNALAADNALGQEMLALPAPVTERKVA